MPYGLLVNGSLAELGDLQYLLSPQVCVCRHPSAPACRLMPPPAVRSRHGRLRINAQRKREHSSEEANENTL